MEYLNLALNNITKIENLSGIRHTLIHVHHNIQYKYIHTHSRYICTYKTCKVGLYYIVYAFSHCFVIIYVIMFLHVNMEKSGRQRSCTVHELLNVC